MDSMTNTTDTKPTQLTAEFLKALRQASRCTDHKLRYSIIVDVIRDADDPTPLTGKVTLHTDVTLPEGFDPPYSSLRISAPAYSKVNTYDGTRGAKRFVASQTHYRSDKGLLTSLANVARVGDELAVRFVIGNQTETLTGAGLSHDTAFVQLFRNNKFVAEFYVADVIAPVGSFARFIDQTYRGAEYTLSAS